MVFWEFAFGWEAENIKNNFYGIGPSFGLYSAYVKSFVEAFADIAFDNPIVSGEMN